MGGGGGRHGWGESVGAGKRKKTSGNREEACLDHNGFSLDATSSRKSSGTTKSKGDLSQNPWDSPQDSEGWRKEENRQKGKTVGT